MLQARRMVLRRPPVDVASKTRDTTMAVSVCHFIRDDHSRRLGRACEDVCGMIGKAPCMCRAYGVKEIERDGKCKDQIGRSAEQSAMEKEADPCYISVGRCGLYKMMKSSLSSMQMRWFNYW